jgi:hypothetical protein
MQSAGQVVRALEDAPVIPAGLVSFLQAFYDVSSDRSSAGGLRFAAVRAWCDEFGAPVELYWDVLREADARLTQWHRHKSRSSAAPAKPSQASTPGSNTSRK